MNSLNIFCISSSSRMNREMNSIPGMNPPAPDPAPAAAGGPGVGPGGPAGPGGPGGAGPDYAALLQYLQFYQKQMGTDGK